MQVSAGTYYENILIENKYIMLLSSDGAENTIIDGSNSGTVIDLNEFRRKDICRMFGELMEHARV